MKPRLRLAALVALTSLCAGLDVAPAPSGATNPASSSADGAMPERKPNPLLAGFKRVVLPPLRAAAFKQLVAATADGGVEALTAALAAAREARARERLARAPHAREHWRAARSGC